MNAAHINYYLRWQYAKRTSTLLATSFVLCLWIRFLSLSLSLFFSFKRPFIFSCSLSHSLAGSTISCCIPSSSRLLYLKISLHLFIYGCIWLFLILHWANRWNIATAELDIFASFICILLLYWFLYNVLYLHLLVALERFHRAETVCYSLCIDVFAFTLNMIVCVWVFVNACHYHVQLIINQITDSSKSTIIEEDRLRLETNKWTIRAQKKMQKKRKKSDDDVELYADESMVFTT